MLLVGSCFFFKTVSCHRQLFDIVLGLFGSSDSLSETVHYVPCRLPAILAERGHKAKESPVMRIAPGWKLWLI